MFGGGGGGGVVTESTLALVSSGWESSDQCMNLNAHIYMVLRLRVHGAIPQFLKSSWYGAQLTLTIFVLSDTVVFEISGSV